MKKWIAILLTALLALTACALAETTEAVDAGVDSGWYWAVLNDPELSDAFPYYSLVDVNGDGVPVLIISTTESALVGDEDQGRVYDLNAGTPELVKAFGGAGGEKFYCNADLHTLTYYDRLSGEEHIEVYAVKDGALTLVMTVDRYQPNHGPVENTDAESFYQNDQEISQEVGEALFAQYANEDEVVTYASTQIANLWQELTEEELLMASGVCFGMPEGAENVVYRWLTDEGIAEMQFALDGDEYCARIKSAALEADQLEDISGMYYTWENVEDVTISGHCHGTVAQAKGEGDTTVELCQWYDLAPGLMYSLSVTTDEPDGLDLTAIAEMVYAPMQGDA